MKAWQFSSAVGGVEHNLFRPASGAPKPKPSDNEILVEVYSMALNPADYKVPELGMVSKLVVPSPSIPGMDFCGKVVELGAKVDWASVGETVFGSMISKIGQGSLGQYVAINKENCAVLPEGVAIDDAAGIGCVGLTAYQSIQPYVKDGDKVFINGGSGGTGVWSIQIAKTLGCHVTTSCSTANVDLCKHLGADEVLDYKSVDLVQSLKEKGQVFSLVVDNVGSPSNLYQASHNFLKPQGRFVQVGMGLGFGAARQLASSLLIPGFLGGGKRPYSVTLVKTRSDELSKLGTWVKEGKVKAITDSSFEYDEAPKAFEKLKTGRAKGKIVIHVSNPK
ncbi:hypothetical protein BDV96DRAFT_611614 [Lophiotrema nucula]|uniref:Enoyl reductase (ER) domain-containing protein n=1 Tax=Lophiotrema nucula TaxID=690887 RepID=A0A6A5ZF10_9PLEO|nr:hypothetical protein BDV96DRAFT_611614 [Lophiotrema nucula]